MTASQATPNSLQKTTFFADFVIIVVIQEADGPECVLFAKEYQAMQNVTNAPHIDKVVDEPLTD